MKTRSEDVNLYAVWYISSFPTIRVVTPLKDKALCSVGIDINLNVKVVHACFCL